MSEEPAQKIRHPKQRPQSAEMRKYAEVVANMATIAQACGCPKDQVINFAKAGLFLQPKQLEAAAKCRLCDAPDGPKAIMSGGGRGSAKTHAILCQIFADDCQRFPGLKVLCLRKIGSTGKEQLDDFCTKLLTRLPFNRTVQPPKITFKNGSFVILGNYKDEKDIDKYLGLEYDLIYIMESNQITQSKKTNILSCLRSAKPGWRPRCYQDTNPGGIDHANNKVIFVDPWKSGRETETRYIHSTIDDNAFVNPEYKEYLDSLPQTGWQYKAWRLGDWEFMAGSYFSNFNERLLVYPNDSLKFNERDIVRWFAAYDFGFSHNMAFLLGGEDAHGFKWIVDEICANTKVPAQQAQEIMDLLEAHQLTTSNLDYIAAGRDCFSKRVDDTTVKTIAEMFDGYGIRFQMANVDRINGWAECHSLFGDAAAGIPARCFVSRNCPNLIEQIKAAQHDLKRQGDVEKFNCDEDGNNGDDALDAFRYMVASDPNKSVKFAQPVALVRNPYKMIGMGF